MLHLSPTDAPILSHQIPPYLGSGSQSVPVPTCWNSRDKANSIQLSQGDRLAEYKGRGEVDADAAAVRANAPMSRQGGLYYFEIKIITKGHEGFIAIGFSEGNVSLNRLPG